METATRKKLPLVLAAVILVAVLYVFNMAYFSIKPDIFTVETSQSTIKGVRFTKTIIALMEHELHGPGGWVPNDIFPSPTWFLDNKPNFQLGVLEAVRYSSRVLRDSISRQRTTDSIDPDCDQAFTSFSNAPYRWIMPSAEGKYKSGIASLQNYAKRIENNNASFYPRSDNLIQLLEQYVSLLGGVNNRLLNTASRRQQQPLPASGVPGEPPSDRSAAQVPWTRIDDNFYYAQGVGYALYHLFLAVQTDFDAVLKDKNAEIIISEIIASLREAYFEPLIITNGSKDGFFANHCNNLRVFLDDARQKSNSLIRMLDQG